MAFSADGIEVFISSRTSRELIASYWMLGANVRVYDDCVTEIVEYRGMDETHAKAKAESLKANNLSDYRISGSGTGAGWLEVPSAKGTITRAEARRQGNSRMFTVTKTTETHTCSNSAGWTEY